MLETLFLGVNSGITVDDLSSASSTTSVPFGISAGYSVLGREGPILDVGPSLNFPSLFTPGARSSTDAGDYVIGLNVVGYGYF